MKIKSFFLFLLCLFVVTGCSDDTDPAITLATTGTVTLDGDTNSTATVKFTSACDWAAVCSADWLEVSPDSGDGGTITLTITAVSENDDTSSRTATVTLVSGSVRESITVEQEASDFIIMEQTEYNVSAEGGTLTIKFTTNIENFEEKLVGYYNATWLSTKAQTRYSGSGYLQMEVAANTSNSARTASVYIAQKSNPSDILATVTIKQAAAESSTSTDYSANKTVVTLQSASMGAGIPIVLLGDGFVDTDIEDGTYATVMEKAMENLFIEEPVASLRDYFDVYYVVAVSENNTFGRSSNTAFSCTLSGNSTLIEGDDELAFEYAQCVDGIDIDNTLVVVVLNTTTYAGTTYLYSVLTSGVVKNSAVSYCPMVDGLEAEGFETILAHEAIGHGFGRLADEYYYESYGTIPDSEIATVKTYQSVYGWCKNIDFTSDTSEVLWASFLSDSRYADEDLGVYEGGYSYTKGVYRPSDDSMMNNNVLGFNAPSRQAIYDRVMYMGYGTTATYEEFVTFDKGTSASASIRTRSTTTPTSRKPLPSPRVIIRH